MANPFIGTVPAEREGSSDIPPADNHLAVLIGLIDLGTQDEEYDGKRKPARKVFLVWELVNQKMSGSKFNHVMGKGVTLSFDTRANLRKLLQGWSGKQFKVGEGYDLTKLLGKACMLNVVHYESKGEKERMYARVEGITPAEKGRPVPPPLRPRVCWWVDSGEPFPDFDWLPYYFGKPLHKVIEGCHERRATTGKSPARPTEPENDDPFGDAPASPFVEQPQEEEVPF